MKVKVTRTETVATLAVLAAVVAFFAFVPAARDSVGTWFRILSTADTTKAMTAFKDYLLGFGVWAPVVSALLMVFQSVVAPLPAFVITFTNGLLFGWLWGAALSWSSAMVGAAVCFYIARFLGRPVVEKLVGGTKALQVSDIFFDRYGDRAVLIARLLPFVSFDIISYGAGLTSIGFWRFFIATGIGQLPATLVYSYLGQNLTGSVKILFFVFSFTIVVFLAASAIRPLYMKRLREQLEAGESAGGVRGKRSLSWWVPAAWVAGLATIFAFAYMAVDTFARDVRLLGNALKSEDISNMRMVLHGFGTSEPAWAYFGTVMRMFTAPWSLGPLAEALVGRLGPGLGWSMLIAGVLTGVVGWGLLVLSIVLGVRALLAKRKAAQS
jgi:uncharacterized membrane protein YdjX (TVP38/TMEM64 family)